jgi:hypothetical protein
MMLLKGGERADGSQENKEDHKEVREEEGYKEEDRW